MTLSVFVKSSGPGPVRSWWADGATIALDVILNWYARKSWRSGVAIIIRRAP